MDSGAVASFVREGALGHVPTLPPSEAEASRRWSDASGGEILQNGQSDICFFTEQGAGKGIRLRRPDQVKKNMCAVSETCDRGDLVLFTVDGGSIIKDPSGNIVRWIMEKAKNQTPFQWHKNVGTILELLGAILGSREAREAENLLKINGFNGFLRSWHPAANANLGQLESIFGNLGTIVGSFWGLGVTRRPFWKHLNPFLGHVEATWRHLGVIWGNLDAIGGHFAVQGGPGSRKHVKTCCF